MSDPTPICKWLGGCETTRATLYNSVLSPHGCLRLSWCILHMKRASSSQTWSSEHKPPLATAVQSRPEVGSSKNCQVRHFVFHMCVFQREGVCNCWSWCKLVLAKSVHQKNYLVTRSMGSATGRAQVINNCNEKETKKDTWTNQEWQVS